MKALVVGGAGFVGSTLVDRLLAEGAAVDVIDILSTGSLGNLADARAERGAELWIHQVDVRARDAVDLIARRAPDVVFHLAAADDAEDCVLAGMRVLAGARAAGARKVVVAVGAGALAEEPGDERAVMERALLGLAGVNRERDGVDFTGLVLDAVYGPRQREDGGVVAALAGAVLAGKPCEVPAGAADLVFVDDAVDALVRAIDRGGGLSLPVGNGELASFDEVHRLLVDATGGEPPGGSAPSRTVGAGALDPARTKIHLGWSPWTSLEEGIAATLRWTAATR